MLRFQRPRKLLVSKVFQAVCLVVLVFMVIVSLSHVTNYRFNFRNLPLPSDPSLIDPTEEGKDGNSTFLKAAPPYVTAIMKPQDTTFQRLNCPTPKLERYEYLRSSDRESFGALPRYLFALDLHESASKLPRLLGSIVEAIRYLGPGNCVLSIVEGRSKDGTYEILKTLRREMALMGTRYYFKTSDINPTAGDRVKALAELRNLALEPLMSHPDQFSKDATIFFANDVAFCMEDILELIHQRVYQGADMTCAMDWTYVGQDPTFYDVWVARDMKGDSFFLIPEDGNWNSAWNLFWNNPAAHGHWQSHQSFQVFACWNGATAFTAKPFLEKKIKFRRTTEKECRSQGEPQLFCKDMWHLGYRKIAVVPSVNIEYSDAAAQKIKDAKGYTSQWAEADSDKIEWEKSPPASVKCMEGYANQKWVPWDEGL